MLVGSLLSLFIAIEYCHLLHVRNVFAAQVQRVSKRNQPICVQRQSVMPKSCHVIVLNSYFSADF